MVHVTSTLMRDSTIDRALQDLADIREIAAAAQAAVDARRAHRAADKRAALYAAGAVGAWALSVALGVVLSPVWAIGGVAAGAFGVLARDQHCLSGRALRAYHRARSRWLTASYGGMQ